MAKEKKPRLPKITIQLSPALQQRMQQVRPPLDWSAIAVEAIEEKLADLARPLPPGPKIIERLKSEQDQRQRDGNVPLEDPRQLLNRETARGKKLGRHWAENEADLNWFERLESLRPHLAEHFREDRPTDANLPEFTTLLEGLFLCYGKENDWGRQIWLWSRFDSSQNGFPDPGASPAYIHGFLQGTLEVWDEVKDKLTR